MKEIKIGILGCGVIGTEAALFIKKNLRGKMRVTAAYDVTQAMRLALQKKMQSPQVVAATSVEELVKRCDMVIEAASVGAVAPLLKAAMQYKKDVVILSIGGLVAEPSLLKAVEHAGINVYLPSGAVAGIDGIQAAAIGKITTCMLTTSKPPAGLGTAVKRKAMNTEKPTVVFQGSAAKACALFPKNINVAGTIFLASRRNPHMKVIIRMDPAISRNIHEVLLESDIARLQVRVENIPSRENPRTSAMAFASVKALLWKLTASVKIGT
jgi:aspartate dehydrogenase